MQDGDSALQSFCSSPAVARASVGQLLKVQESLTRATLVVGDTLRRACEDEEGCSERAHSQRQAASMHRSLARSHATARSGASVAQELQAAMCLAVEQSFGAAAEESGRPAAADRLAPRMSRRGAGVVCGSGAGGAAAERVCSWLERGSLLDVYDQRGIGGVVQQLQRMRQRDAPQAQPAPGAARQAAAGARARGAQQPQPGASLRASGASRRRRRLNALAEEAAPAGPGDLALLEAELQGGWLDWDAAERDLPGLRADLQLSLDCPPTLRRHAAAAASGQALREGVRQAARLSAEARRSRGQPARAAPARPSSAGAEGAEADREEAGPGDDWAGEAGEAGSDSGTSVHCNPLFGRQRLRAAAREAARARVAGLVADGRSRPPSPGSDAAEPSSDCGCAATGTREQARPNLAKFGERPDSAADSPHTGCTRFQSAAACGNDQCTPGGADSGAGSSRPTRHRLSVSSSEGRRKPRPLWLDQLPGRPTSRGSPAEGSRGRRPQDFGALFDSFTATEASQVV